MCIGLWALTLLSPDNWVSLNQVDFSISHEINNSEMRGITNEKETSQ